MPDKTAKKIVWEAYYSAGFIYTIMHIWESLKDKKSVGLSQKEVADKLFDGKEKAAEEFIKWADTNKDGKIDFFEFFSALLEYDYQEGYPFALLMIAPGDRPERN
ncbi:hypothetical protein BDV26DRAFT_255173, partial [Aspergillus bertholletiae]